MDTFFKAVGAVGAVVVALCCIALLAVVMAYPTKWMVNYLVALGALMAVFGVPALTFWKALALNYITAVLFKGTSATTKSK